MQALITTLALALTFTACEGGPSSPTQPSVTLPPSSPAALSPVTEWSVAQYFASVSGPDNCWVRQQRARLTGVWFDDLPMTVTHSGDSILFESEFFDVNYAGTLSGSQFSASGGPLGGGGAHPCPDGPSVQQLPGVSTLSGRFFADDQSLSATEVNTYLLTSGEAVTYTWNWDATRLD